MGLGFKIIIVLLLAGFIFQASSQQEIFDCPKKCWCYHTSVRCMFQSLTWVPKVPKNTTVL